MDSKELAEKIKELEFGETLAVEVGEDVRGSARLLTFQEESLGMTLQALRENRYGLYDRDSVIKTMAEIEDKRVERESFIGKVGETLLGPDWRERLNQAGAEFRIDTALPVAVFFRVAR